MHVRWFVPLLLLCGCGGARLVKTDCDHLRETIPLTRWSFEDGTQLAVVADQGVSRYQLTPAAGGAWNLEWEHAPDVPAHGRTLQIEAQRIAMRPEPGHEGELGGTTSWGSAFVLLLQGNGQVQLVDPGDEVDLKIKYGANARAYLGLQALEGDRVAQVAPGSPAAEAGVRPGDRLISATVGGATLPLTDRFMLAELLPRLRPGERVTLRVERGGEPLDLGVELGERPLALWNRSEG